MHEKKLTGILFSHNQFVFLWQETTNWKWEIRILVAAICERRNERRTVEDSTRSTGETPSMTPSTYWVLNQVQHPVQTKYNAQYNTQYELQSTLQYCSTSTAVISPTPRASPTFFAFFKPSCLGPFGLSVHRGPKPLRNYTAGPNVQKEERALGKCENSERLWKTSNDEESRQPRSYCRRKQ